MTSNNINKKNIKPFFNSDIVDPRFNLREILSQKNFGLPLIPGMYFVNNKISPIKESLSNIKTSIISPPLSNENNFSKIYEYDNIGTKSISAYNNIKNSLYKLETIKKFITTILTDNKKLFEVVNISKETYKLNKKNIFFNFKEKLSDNFESVLSKESTEPIEKNKEPSKLTIPLFIHILIKNNYSILKKKVKKTDNPDFMFIFQNEYNGKSKSFFYKLFQEYNKERKKLIKYIKSYYGLLAFDFIFDIKYKLDIENKNSIIPNTNLDNFQIIEKNNTEGNNYKEGNKVVISGKSGYISKINYNNSNKPYTIEYNDKTIISNKKSFSNLKRPSGFNTNIAKPTLQSKIHNFDLLYQSIIGESIIKSQYSKKINSIYSKFYNCIDNYLSGKTPFNLYNIIINNLDLDINLFKFIFNYVDVNIFNNAVDVHYQIKDYINNKLITFETYYDSYIIWYNKVKGFISNKEFLVNEINENDFENFLKDILNNLS